MVYKQTKLKSWIKNNCKFLSKYTDIYERFLTLNQKKVIPINNDNPNKNYWMYLSLDPDAIDFLENNLNLLVFQYPTFYQYCKFLLSCHLVLLH